MAADKLVDSAKLDSALTATADAIRAKTGSADKIVWNSETGFASVIEAITGGGSSDEWEILMPATDVNFDGGEYISFESVYPLELGKTYRVIWKGEEFICETEQITFNGMPCIAMGNTGMLTGEAGEHPFLIGYIPDASGFGIFTTDLTSNTHNVTIYKEKTAIIEGAHVVTFMSDDGATVLGVKPVMNGDTCGDPIALGLFSTPTKESTAQYEYTFSGWSTTASGAADANALVNITEDKTVYAAFKSDTRAYTIRFLDGDTVLQTMICEYGTTPEYTPEKVGFRFDGWTPSLTAVTGDADYTALWTSILTFANATWEEINTICEAGEAANYFNVGDEKTVINGEYSHTLRIIGLNLDTKSDGSGNAGITVMVLPLTNQEPFNTIANEQAAWNAVNGAAYAWTTKTFPNTLPTELKQYVKQTTHKTAAYITGQARTFTYNEYYFSPSVYECNLYPSSYLISSYDSGIKYPGLSTATQRILKNSAGEAVTWRTRNNSYQSTPTITATGNLSSAKVHSTTPYNCVCFCI